MKTRNYLFTVMLAVLLSPFVSNGQSFETQVFDLSDNSIESLIEGINSDNEGLKRACVYLAGKYKISVTVAALRDQLAADNTSANKILIARALYEIGDFGCMYNLKRVAVADTSAKARRICSAIYTALAKENSKKYFALGEN